MEGGRGMSELSYAMGRMAAEEGVSKRELGYAQLLEALGACSMQAVALPCLLTSCSSFSFSFFHTA